MNYRLPSLARRCRARLMRLKGKQRSEDERRRTRQKIIIGAALLTDAAMRPERKEWLLTVLQRAVIVERDRVAIANILAGDLSAFAKNISDGQESP